MAISDLLNRRVRAQPEEDEEVYSEESGSEEISNNGSTKDEDDESDASEGDSSHDSDSNPNAASDLDPNEDQSDSDSDSQPDDNIQDSLNNISFGALAKAQASMGPKKESRKPQTTDPTPTKSPLDEIRARIREAREQKRQSQSSKPEKQARASKHAPTVMSSKRAVTRKRPVVDLSAATKARDPRFDPTVLSNSSRGHPNAGNAYSFLDEYRVSELKDLKAKMAKTKNPEEKEELKRAVRSAGDRLRSIENKKREQEVMAEHKKREKQLIREGKKSTPYYLKRSDLKEKMLVKKYENMGSRERAKALERRRKKATAKERKDMPMERRMGDTTDGDAGSGGRKRRRMA